MAANLASGHGFVYNPGEWHLGSTAALYGMMLAALGWLFGPDRIPAISGVALVRFDVRDRPDAAGARRRRRRRERGRAGWRAGVAAGLLYAASPLLFVTFGGEMPFLLALVTGAFLAERRGRPALAAVLAALAAVTRPDGVLVIAVVLATMAVRGRRWPWREGVLAAARTAAVPRPGVARLRHAAAVDAAGQARAAGQRPVGHVRPRPHRLAPPVPVGRHAPEPRFRAGDAADPVAVDRRRRRRHLAAATVPAAAGVDRGVHVPPTRCCGCRSTTGTRRRRRWACASSAAPGWRGRSSGWCRP